MANKLGWIVAGILVLGLIVFVVIKLAIPQPTPPDRTARKPELLEMVELDWPGAAAGRKPDGSGDAADDYMQASAAARSHQATIEAAWARVFDAGNAELPAETLAALEEVHGHVAAGAKKAACRYAARHAGAVRVSPEFAPASDLKRIFDALMLVYVHYREGVGDIDTSERIARDTFAFGWHLVQERGHINVVLAGIQTQMLALGHFTNLYGKTGERSDDEPAPKASPLAAKATKEYTAQLDELLMQYNDKMQIIYDRQPHPGDVFNIVENDADGAWRVQALLTCGVLLHTGGRRGDTRYARKLIERHLGAQDALLAAAAKAANACTKQQVENYVVPRTQALITWPPGVQRSP